MFRMKRLLLLTVVLLVGLGTAAGAFHTHAGSGHCNLCKDARVATPVVQVVATETAPRTPELVASPRRISRPEAHAYSRPPLRAPPSA
jgi:hypothetical protein